MQRLCLVADKRPFTPLVESIRSPQTDPLFNGIELGGDFQHPKKLLGDRKPDSIIIGGLTPLMVAAHVGNWKSAKALLSVGADVNFIKPPEVLASPLYTAVSNSKFPTACQLVQSGAKLYRSHSDKFEMMRAALSMNPSDAAEGSVFIDYLLRNGFDANDMGSENQTPLMSAVSLHNIPTIKVLLKHGARLDIVKKGDRTVWGIAYEKNNKQVLKLLDAAQKRESREMEKQSASPTSG